MWKVGYSYCLWKRGGPTPPLTHTTTQRAARIAESGPASWGGLPWLGPNGQRQLHGRDAANQMTWTRSTPTAEPCWIAGVNDMGVQAGIKTQKNSWIHNSYSYNDLYSFVPCSHKKKNKLFFWSFPFSGRFRLFNTFVHIAFEEYCCESFSVLNHPNSSTYNDDCFCFFLLFLKTRIRL